MADDVRDDDIPEDYERVLRQINVVVDLGRERITWTRLARFSRDASFISPMLFRPVVKADNSD